MADFNQAIQELKKENVHPVYLLTGTEHYFIEQFKSNLIKKMKNEIEDEATVYDLQEVAIQDVIIDVETLPFFTEKKVIFVTNPIFLKTKHEKLQVTHDLEVLEQYLTNPVPYSILVIIAPYEKLDERKRITKQLKKQTKVVQCQPLRETQLRKWVLHIAKNFGVTIDQESCMLLETEFQDLHMLQKEIEKLAFYVGEGGEVTKEITKEMMSTSLNQNALQLVDAVLQKDLHEAIKIYKNLEKMKEDPIGLLALLSYQFRIIFQVKLLQKKGYPIQRIQSEIKVHPYVVKLASERSARFTEQKLKSIINELTNTDAMIKRGLMDKGMAFELLLYKLATGA